MQPAPVAQPNEIAVDPSSLAAGTNTQHHFQDPSAGTGINGITDPTTVVAINQTIGSPEVVLVRGQVVVEGDETSPHLKADQIKAKVYVAGAIEDQSFTPEQAELLRKALIEAGVDHTVEFYPARHGFAVEDHVAVYDAAAAQRHYEALESFYGAHL